MFKKLVVGAICLFAVRCSDSNFNGDVDQAFDNAFEDNEQAFAADEGDAEQNAMNRMFEEIDAAEESLGEEYLEQRLTACLRAVRVSMVRDADNFQKEVQELQTKWNFEEDQARNAHASSMIAFCNRNIDEASVKSIMGGKVFAQKVFDTFFQPNGVLPTLSKRQSERLRRIVQKEEEEGNVYGREALSAAPLGLVGASWSKPVKTIWFVAVFALVFAAGYIGLLKLKEIEAKPAEVVVMNRKERRHNAKQGKSE
eukprot:GDKJ01010274.1.p1 GENE.GDKJ01010274.1~~GDKJ01010274.1.p1  ORF type:complete len:255 (-),score=79.98 GDKJ01010274.1:196-960(-)